MGNSLSREREELEEPRVEVLEHSFVIKHQGFRVNQEDDFDALTTSLGDTPIELYCVLDGHGGSASVEHCKTQLLANLSNSIRFNTSLNLFDKNALEHSLEQAFITTENQLTDLFKSSGSSPIVLSEKEQATAIQSSLLDTPSESTILKTRRFNALSQPFQPQSQPFQSYTPSSAPPPLNLRVPQNYLSSDDDSGCCAIVCIKTPSHLCLASAGDCRAVLLSKDGSFEVLFEDHNPVIEGEKRRIKDAGLTVYQGRVSGELAVSRSIGDFKYKGTPTEHYLHAVTCVPTIKIHTRKDSDYMLLLMSDGIVDGISMEDLARTMSSGDCSTNLIGVVKSCLEPGKSRDNMTLFAIPL
jgi:serine/threonine protein phosphatase PrpC